MGQRFDFTPSLDAQNIEIPINNGLTSLHSEFVIEAPADPPGRIVSIFGLRGNLTGQGRKKKRPLHFNFTQGQDGQARWEAEITALNPKGQERGPIMPFPGEYRLVIDWSAISGVASCTVIDLEGENGPNALGRFLINGPSTSSITNGFLYIGGHISKPPAPGELPVYTTPLGCRLKGFVAFNGEQIDVGDNGRGDDDDVDQSRPIDPLPPSFPQPPIFTPPPPVIQPPVQPPVIKPTPPIFAPNITTDGNSSSSGFNFGAFPQFVAAAIAFYPELGKSLGQIEPYIQAIQAGKRLAGGNFSPTNPNDLISVLQLINLFKSL